MFRKVIQTLKKDSLQGIQVSIDQDSAPNRVYLTFRANDCRWGQVFLYDVHYIKEKWENRSKDGWVVLTETQE